ncbi:MAG: RNB domain-containing ribonuclease, partial [Candidatus Saccharimonadales bacterium]
MRYGDLGTPALQEFAHQEATDLFIPPAYLRERDLVEGIAIDTPEPADFDDAISLTKKPSGESMLHVSISDLGDFIKPETALQKLSLRRLYTIYRGDIALAPMLPPEISEDKLSLLGGKPRPVVTFHIPVTANGYLGKASVTRDTLVAQSFTPQEIKQRRSEEVYGGQFTELEILARTLFTARHVEGELATLEDERGYSLSTEQDIGSLIVQEAMIAAGTSMAQYFQDHNIPGLYRIHTLSPSQREAIASRPELAGFIANARYSVSPDEHIGLNLTGGFMHITSPIRRYPDLVNHINLAAHLDGIRPPFRRGHLTYVASRLARIAADRRNKQDTAIDTDGRLRTEQLVRRTEIKQIPKKSVVDRLSQKLASDTFNEADLTRALFEAFNGSSESEVQALREAPADIVGKEIAIARSILQIVVAKGIVRLETTSEDVARDGSGSLQLVATNANDESYPYKITKSPVTLYLRTARLIGQLAGVEIHPVVPERMTREGRIRLRPFEYLRRLDIEKRGMLLYHRNDVDETSGEVTLEIRFTINGERHMRKASGDGKKSTARQLCNAVIDEFDLLDNPPAVLPPKPKKIKGPAQSPKGTKSSKKDLQTNPVSVLSVHASKSYAPHPRYTNTTASNGDGIVPPAP